MKLLDSYILKRFFSTLCLILGVIILLIILIHAADNAFYFRKHQLPLQAIVNYYCTLLPFMANFLAPIIVFATTIWVTTRLTQRSEIIAMLSGGISFHRLAVPYLAIALLLTGLNFYLTGWMLADANKARIEFETKYFDIGFLNKSDSLYLKVGPEVYMYISKYHSYSDTGYDVSVDTFQDGVLKENISAQKTIWNKKNKMWELIFWKKRLLISEGETLEEGYKLPLSLALDPEDFEINPSLKEGLTLSELDLHIQKLLNKGDETVSFFIAEKHVRYMTPFAILILIALGFLVAVHKPRKGVGRQITLGFALACLYIALFLSAKTVVEIQSEHPLLDIWMPNIIFSLLCIIFYRLVPK